MLACELCPGLSEQMQWCTCAGSGARDSALTQRALRRVLIASVMEEYERGPWEELIGKCEEVGVDAFEINFSCPHGMPERKMGMAMGQDCSVLEVCPHCSVPALKLRRGMMACLQCHRLCDAGGMPALCLCMQHQTVPLSTQMSCLSRRLCAGPHVRACPHACCLCRASHQSTWRLKVLYKAGRLHQGQLAWSPGAG